MQKEGVEVEKVQKEGVEGEEIVYSCPLLGIIGGTRAPILLSKTNPSIGIDIGTLLHAIIRQERPAGISILVASPHCCSIALIFIEG